LIESMNNLEKVADYCEENYTQTQDKRMALEETKNYTTQSLASVAYQINTWAFGFLQMLDLQASQMEEMESQINHISQTVDIHKEKVARREIGVLTTNKSSSRQYKILAPANQERPIKYVRRPIDYSALDDIGHGVRIHNELPRQKSRAGSQGSSSSLMGIGAHNQPMMTGTLMRGHSPVPPAPTSKPPTPPTTRTMDSGTMRKGSREYRTPPAVAPPQVPSNYASNYPLGHSRRERNSQSGYGTLPMPHTENSRMSMNQSPYNAPVQNTPQVGTVHPLPHGQHGSATYAPGSVSGASIYAPGLERQRSYSNPPPPSPGILKTMEIPAPASNYGTVNSKDVVGRMRSVSPPPPPLPIPEEDVSGTINRRRVLPENVDLPGWVPKDFIDKVVAVYDYYADKEDELSFQENSIIYVLRKNDDGWWEGILDGITGLFPGNYVESCA